MHDTPNPPGSAIEAAAPLAPVARVVPLASGRSIEVTEGAAEDRIQIRSTRGEVVLSVRVTDEGPVLSLAGVSLEIAASKTLALSCETLEIKAAQDASIAVGGSLRERVGGSVTREAAGVSTIAAREVKLDASPGGMVLRANDDVAITGERVRLNSDDPPMPLTWEEHRARRALVADKPKLEEAVAAALLEARRGPPERGDR
jgi:hypothetical protein